MAVSKVNTATKSEPDKAPEDVTEETPDQSADDRIKFLEERNEVLEKRLLALETKNDTPNGPEGEESVPMVVHKVVTYEDVPGVGMVQGTKDIRIPLSENEAYERAHGLR